MTDDEASKFFRQANEETLGKFGESFWKAVFKASDVGYIPLAQIANGGAPIVVQSNGGTVLPDFDCSDVEWTAYVESKCKCHNVLFRKRKQIRHGIDRRNWLAYREVAQKYRKRCAIGIVECFHDNGQGFPGEWSGEFMLETLDELGEPFPGEGSERHMVYWKKKSFRNLDALTPSELYEVAKGIRKAPVCRFEFERIFAGLKQRDLFT